MIAATYDLEPQSWRVVYELDGEEHVEAASFGTIRGASDEAWRLRRAGLVAWAEEVRG